MLAQVPSDEPMLDRPALFRIPLDIDIPLHGLPGPFLLLDFFLFEQTFSRQAMDRLAPVLAVLLSVTYSSWVEYCASYNGSCEYCIIL
jgi:FAR-17a/AIG1-like protein